MAPDAESLLQHASGIRSLLRGLLADDARIDDVLQDTWVAALSKGPRPGVPLGPWLKRVARNFGLRLRRGEARRSVRERAVARPDATPEARFDLQREAVDELSKLDEPYRSTLILVFFEGLSPSEIAAKRGMPAATVRSHLKRGLDRIRERLDRSHGSRGAWGAVVLPWLATGEAAAATGVIVMGAKVKFVLAAVLMLAIASGTAGVLVARQSSRAPSSARAESSHASRAEVEVASASAAPGVEPASGSERSVFFRGRIVDAITKKVVPGAAVRIRLAGHDRTVELIADGAGRFRGTSPDLSESALGPLFPLPGRLTSCGIGIAATGYGLQRVSAKPTIEGGDELDFGDIEVVRGVPVSGRVVHKDGHGIADAMLLLSLENFFPPAFAFPIGRSGAQGVFTLDEMVPPTAVERPWTLLAICDEGLGWRPVEVLAGRERLDGVEILVDPAATLEVVVTDQKGAPLAAAYVRLEPRFRPLHPGPEYSGHGHDLWVGTREDVKAILTASADARGRAVFARLPMPGPYDVVARAEGFTLGWQDNVAVDRAERRAVTLRLEPQRLCAVVGTVLAADGSPLPGATVGMRELPNKATSDAAGRFRVEGLEPAWRDVTLVAAAEGYPPRSREVRLCTDRDIEGVEFRLERAMPIGGRVVDQDGTPVAGVYLDLLRNREGLHPDGDRTGADGRFLFKDATAGPWKLRVFAPQDKPELEVCRDLEVRGGDTGLEVVLKRLRLGTTKLVARVTEAATGKALDAANAQLHRGDAERTSEYANPSRVERRSGEVIAERLPPGAWRLWVQVPGYAPACADFTVSAAQAEARVEVRLGPAGRIVGKVTGLRGKAAVYTTPSDTNSGPGTEFETDGRIRGWGIVAEDGTFVIEKLLPGPTRVWLAADGLVGEATVDVPSGGDAQVEIVATPAAGLGFRSKGPVPAGVEAIEFYIAQGEADLKCVMRLGCVADCQLRYEATLLPGRTRWCVVFDSDGRVRTQEGVVELVVGQTAEVFVPIELER